MKANQLLVFLLVLVFLVAVASAFVYNNPKKEVILKKNGIETISLSEILKEGELHYDKYTAKVKIQNDTALFILSDDAGTFFSRYSYKLDNLRSGFFTVFDSEGNRKTYYLNVDTKIASETEGEKTYIIKFKEPPLLEKKELLEKEFDAKKRHLVMSSRGNMVNVQKKIDDLEVEMKKELENHEIKIKNYHNLLKENLGVKEKKIKEFKNVFNGIVLSLKPSEVEKIRNLSYVDNVYEDTKVQTFLNDSVKQINATDAWKMLDNYGRNLTGLDVKIAIIDTGVDYTHPDLGGCLGPNCKVIGGYDFVNKDNDPMDDNGHGTHVAGIAAGNGTLKGVAPDAKILAYKVLDRWGYGTLSDVITGVEMAVEDSADIISMSLGGRGSPDGPLAQAIDNAVASNVVVIAAAGNWGPGYETISTPANARTAIAVGAVDKNNSIASFSSRGPVIWNNTAMLKPELVAPGVDICSAQFDSFYSSRRCIDDEHISLSGTSMAAPHVSGVVALLKQLHREWTVDDIKSALITTSTDLGYNLVTQGSGLVNALNAVNTSLLFYPYVINVSFSGSSSPIANITITIKNIRQYQISVNLTAENATTKYGGSYNISYLNTTSIIIPSGSEGAVLFTLNMTNHGGILFGKIRVNAEGRNYTIPYIVNWMVQLNVTVAGSGMTLYPDIYIHTDEIDGRDYAYQFYDFYGQSYNFLVPANKNITVYAIGDMINKSLAYILMKKVNTGQETGVVLNLSNDSRPFTLNATALDGSTLKLYQLEFGFSTYREGYPPIKVLYYNYFYIFGNQVFYFSNKPEAPYDTDFILKYVGIPVKR